MGVSSTPPRPLGDIAGPTGGGGESAPAPGPAQPAPAGAPAPVSDAPRRRAWLRNGLHAALLLPLGLAVLELTVRLEEWVQYRTPLLSPVRSQSDLIMRDEDGAHGRPNVRFRNWEMNALGMRGPAATAAKPANTFRVIAVGASETFGLYESAGHEFPRQLEDSLNQRAARCTAGAPRFEVLNAAMPGMSLPTIEQDIRRRLSRLQADAILIYPTPAGFLDDAPPVAARPDSSGATALPATNALRPRALARAREQVKLLLPGFALTWLREAEIRRALASRPAGWRFTAVPHERLALYEQALAASIDAARAIGAVPVVATHANMFMGRAREDHEMLVAWSKFYPRADERVIVQFDSAARLSTLAIARDSGAVAVDVADRLTSAPTDAFADFVHFSDGGAALVASTLTPALLALGVPQGCVPAAHGTSTPRTNTALVPPERRPR